MKWTTIDRWSVHSGLVEAFALNIKKELEKFPDDVQNDVVIMFSAHSLPMTVSFSNFLFAKITKKHQKQKRWSIEVILILLR